MKRDVHIYICICVQLDVTIYTFILEIQKIFIFRAFLDHLQEKICGIISSWYNKL
jgi:hypothetical protein